MSERLRESLSAVMDGEANELELERVLSRIGDDEQLRQTWVRYNAVQSMNEGAHISHMSMDVSRGVRAALAQDDTTEDVTVSSSVQRFFKPLASFAVAASVAATVVIGGQQLYQIGDTTPYGGNITAGTSPVGLINTVGATAVQASYGTQSMPVLQPTVRTAYRELARQRMQKYMQEHVEQAALNSPQGMIPFSRIQKIEE